MSTYTTAANYEREQPEPLSTEQKIQSYAELHGLTFKEAVNELRQINLDHFAQDEVPFLDDLNDLSAHEPSIRTGESVSSDSLLKQIMDEYDAAPEDGSFEGDHPIVQMAAEIDSLRAKVKAYAGYTHEAMSFIAGGHGNKKGRELFDRLTKAIRDGEI